jgi:hypothetical protein
MISFERIIAATTFVLASNAIGDCNATRVEDLSSLLNNSTVCATGTGPNAGDRWQEWHQTDASNTLTEYARGPDDPVDETRDVGTWSINNNNSPDATVTHDYGGGQEYTWSVHHNGGSSYSFCTGPGGTEVATADITPGNGQIACP